MQRKHTPKLGNNVERLPQMNNMSYSNIPFSTPHNHTNNPMVLPPFQSPTLKMALSALPLFGGVEEDTSTETEEDKKKKTISTDTGTKTESAGGTTTTTAVTTTELTPQQIADLIAKNEKLETEKNQLLSENNGYKAKDQEAERAKLGREEALQKDVEDRDATIVKLDAALKNQAVINAINSYEEIKFHDPKFAISKLDPSIAENMVVDLDNGTVTVTGIENDLKRIANENEWAVKKRAQTEETQDKTSSKNKRPSGTPPPPPNGGGTSQARREALIDRHPVLAQGRTRIPR